MSLLASQAEVIKLGRVLGVEPGDLEFLGGASAESLRMLRESVTEHLLEEDRPFFRRLAQVFERVPTVIAAKIARSIDPMVVAGVAVEIQARRVVTLGQRLHTPFLADVCMHLDPRRARDAIRLFPVDLVVDVALELDSRDDLVTMSRFVDYVSDDTMLAVEEALHDESRLLRVAFLMESKNRVDHIFRMLPPERVQRMLVRVQEDPEGLLSEFLSLLIHVSYGFKRELGDILAAQDEELIDGYIRAVDQRGLWSDVLPVVAAMSDSSRARVVNLPALREKHLQANILRTAEESDMWGQVLLLITMMGEDNREAVARIMANTVSLDAATDAALIGEYWEVLLDLVARMPGDKHNEFAGIIRAIGDVDQHLYERIVARAEVHGISIANAATSHQPVAQ